MLLDNSVITTALLFLAVLLPSVILHEVAHGVIAERLGDPTARLLGRITLNPIPHIDPIYSLLLPLVLFIGSGGQFLFGAAKPVPVDFFNLRDGRKDMAIVSLAGPLTNIVIAILGALLLKASLGNVDPFFSAILFMIVKMNIWLAIFNLIPVPPLDGSKVFALILPEKDATTYLSFGNLGFLILFFLLAFPIGGFSLGALISNVLNYSLRLLGI